MNEPTGYIKNGLPLGMGCPICDIGQLYGLTNGVSAWGVDEHVWTACELCGDYQVGEYRLEGLCDTDCIKGDEKQARPKKENVSGLLFI